MAGQKTGIKDGSRDVQTNESEVENWISNASWILNASTYHIYCYIWRKYHCDGIIKYCRKDYSEKIMR